jgi:glycosyltransferase involved in cell wall biosynthesis
VIAQVLFIIFLVVGLGAAGFSIFGGLVYDIKLLRLNKKVRLHPYSKALRKRPLITLIVLVDANNSTYLEQCLLSIARSNYRKYEIILASNLPAARTSQAVKNLKKKYRSKKIKTVKIAGSNWQAVAKKSKTEYVAVLSSSCEVDSAALSKAVQFLALRPNVNIALPHFSKLPDYTIRGLVERYNQILQNQWQKPMTLLNSARAKRNDFLIYRKNFTGSDLRSEYCANINIFLRNSKQPAIEQNMLNHAVKSLALLLVFIAVSYSIYLSFANHYTALLGLVWAGFSLYLAVNIWAEEYLGFSKKILMSLMAPMVCLLIFLSIPKLLLDLASAQPARQYTRVQFV